MEARLVPMTPEALAAWRRSAESAGTGPGTGPETCLEIVIGDVAVGGVAIAVVDEGPGRRAVVRSLQTTLHPDDRPSWSVVLDAVERYAVDAGARTVHVGVPVALAGSFQAAGYGATMTTQQTRLPPEPAPSLQVDRRVDVRPMTDDERVRFAAEAPTLLREGLLRSGALASADAPPTDDEVRAAALADGARDDDLLLTGTVDGRPVGRFWATVSRGPDGDLALHGNSLDLFPEHRGQGLTPSFLGAAARYIRTIGIGSVAGQVYGQDVAARATLDRAGVTTKVVHLRKDLPAR